MIEILYQDEIHTVELHRCQGIAKGLLHTFTPFQFRDVKSEGFGVNHLLSKGYDVISFKCIDDSWFQGLTEDAILGVGTRSTGYPFVATYGYSMGGFAAIAFADHLRANVAIAISPQYSIKEDFDKRWAPQAKSIESWRHEIDARATRNCNIVILYDSKFHLDHAQVSRIRDKVDPSKLRIIEVPFSGHFTLRFLVQGGMLAGILDALLKGEERVEISYRWSRLRNSLVFMSEMGAHALSTGRNELAIACFRKAVTLDPGNALFQHRLSELMGRTGRIEEAIRHSRQAVALGPANAAFQHRLSDLLGHSGRIEETRDTPSAAIGAGAVQPVPIGLQQACVRR